jgi:hypothetical protein
VLDRDLRANRYKTLIPILTHFEVVEARGYAAVRGRAVCEGRGEEAELLFRKPRHGSLIKLRGS